MADQELIDRIMQSCTFRFRDVVCPSKEKVAKIAAARMQLEDSEWSVVECSLQPDGEVNCAMSCLLREIEPEN
jgi:hypothetical protein